MVPLEGVGDVGVGLMVVMIGYVIVETDGLSGGGSVDGMGVEILEPLSSRLPLLAELARSSGSFFAFKGFFPRLASGEGTANSCALGIGGGTKEEEGDGKGDEDARSMERDKGGRSVKKQKRKDKKLMSV